MSKKILDIKNLIIQYNTDAGAVKAVNGVSFAVQAGQSYGLVGETGAGKTTTCLGILRLFAKTTGEIVGGEVYFEGENLLKKSEREMQRIRGEKISMIFQDPMTSLNPVKTIGKQISEVIKQHQECSRKEAWERTMEMLKRVGIPAERANEYPHQFSGGMKQRVVIAMALACNPALLLADEPTSALDVTIQAQVLDMIKNLQKEYNMALVLITHDLGIVAESCENVAIIYAGQIVEAGTTREVFKNAGHPYTKGLFAAIPRLDMDVKRLNTIQGLMPDPVNLPKGCSFHPRCPYAETRCGMVEPEVIEISRGHYVRCHLAGREGEKDE